jgi:hypothetical protein
MIFSVMLRVLIFLLAVSALSEIKAQSKHPVLFENKGIEHKQSLVIPGTSVKISPPPGFSASTTFTGLRNGSSMIEVFDIPGGAYRALAGDFTREKLEQQGVQVLSVQDVNVNGFEGRLLKIQHAPGQNGLTLVFGDGNFTVILVCNYPSDQPAIGEDIQRSILGIEYDRVDVHDGLASAAFRLKSDRSLFKYDNKSANTFYYRLHGHADDAYFTVTQLVWDYSTRPSTIGELMLNEMKKYGLENADVRKRSARKVNGYDAYESEIYATRKGSRCLVYQMVVVHDSRAVVIHGIGKKDFKKNRHEFRKLAHSLEFK